MYIFSSSDSISLKVMVRRIDNDGNTVWTSRVGDSHKTFRRLAYSVGFSIAQVSKQISSIKLRFLKVRQNICRKYQYT